LGSNRRGDRKKTNESKGDDFVGKEKLETGGEERDSWMIAVSTQTDDFTEKSENWFRGENRRGELSRMIKIRVL